MRMWAGGARRDNDEGKPKFSDIPVSHLFALLGHALKVEKGVPQEYVGEYELPIEALLVAQERFQTGAQKYGKDNWRKGIPVSVYYDSLMRHLHQWRAGDTSENHLGAVVFNIFGIIVTEIMVKRGELPATYLDMGVYAPESLTNENKRV